MAQSANIWRDSERDSWAPKTEQTIAEWSEDHRILSATSEERGPFRLRRVPYMRPIMDAALDPDIEEIVICKSAQIAYTTILENIVGYFSTEESSAILFVLADEDTAVYIAEERLERMFIDSPAIRRHYESGQFNRSEIKLANGSYIAMAWASSVAKLGTKSFKYILLDEIDKPGYYLGSREAGAISLARERKESYYRFKVIMGSTPTTDAGNVMRELDSCDVVYDWHVPCPACGIYQPLRFGSAHCHGFADGVYRGGDGVSRKLGRIKWDGGREATAEQIADAVYECGSCSAPWSNLEKDQAVERGKMVARSETTGRGRKVGFHLNRVCSLLGKSGNLSKLVESWISSVKSGDPKALQGFVNSTLAEPWVQTVVRAAESDVLKARCALNPQTAPSDSVALTCGIDMQRHGFWFVVRAWARDFRSWMIHYGFLPAWESVEALLFDTRYPIDGLDGQGLQIWRAGIDTGGGKGAAENDPTLTEQAYYWIRRNGVGRGCLCYGTKGASHPLVGKVRAGKRLDQTPSGKPIPGGLQIVLIDTDAWKNAYHYRLKSAIDGGPMAAYLHAETGVDYARQIMAEELRLNHKGVQEWIRVKPDNHLLDAEMLAMAVADPEWPGGGVNILAVTRDAEALRNQAMANRRRVIDEREPGSRPRWMERRR